MGFGSGVGDLAAFVVRNTVLEPVVGDMTTLQKADTTGSSFGGYFGYNSKWESLILGFEVNYSHMAMQASSSDSVSVIYSNDAGAPPGHHFTYDPLTVSGSATIRITDLATFRARAGWTVGQFLPYAFVGAAIARADVTRSAIVSFTRKDNPDLNATTPAFQDDPFSQTQSDVKNGGFYWGYTAGIGLEFEIMPRVIARGEWEYVELPNVKNTGVSINSLRAGIGFRF
jgi:opacity protein-like surface antigen